MNELLNCLRYDIFVDLKILVSLPISAEILSSHMASDFSIPGPISTTANPPLLSTSKGECQKDLLRDSSAIDQGSLTKEELFRMAENCPSMLWMTDASGDIQFANKASRTFCGGPEAENDPNSWDLFTQPRSAPEYAKAFRHSVAQRNVFKAEARVQRVDGKRRYIGTTAEPVFRTAGIQGMSALPLTLRSGMERRMLVSSSFPFFIPFRTRPWKAFWRSMTRALSFHSIDVFLRSGESQMRLLRSNCWTTLWERWTIPFC